MTFQPACTTGLALTPYEWAVAVVEALEHAGSQGNILDALIPGYGVFGEFTSHELKEVGDRLRRLPPSPETTASSHKVEELLAQVLARMGE